MFAYLSGVLKSVSPESVILEVGGIGYRIEIPLSLFSKLPSLGQFLKLHVAFVIREFSQAFYGFLTEEERDLFEILLGVSGVGPKLALSLMGHLKSDELYQAVHLKQVEILARVPGIGKKKGERILLELEGKLHFKYTDSEQVTKKASSQAGSYLDDATRALVHLGYPHVVAVKAVKKGLENLGEGAALSDLIREALSST